MARGIRDSHRSFLARTNELLIDFQAAPSTAANARVHKNNREWCVLALHDAWTDYCRGLVISSAISGSRALSGATVPAVPGIRNASQALTTVRTTLNPKGPGYWEPRWGDALWAIRAAQALKIHNVAQVAGSLGSTPSPAEEVRRVRNYIAHRNQSTADPLRSVMGVAGAIDPGLDSYLASLVGPLETRYGAWVRQLRLIATSASQ